MDADARFRAKLAARAAGTAPVFVDEPAMAKGDDQAAIDSRYQAKLARHGKATAPAAAPEAKAEPAETGGSSAPAGDAAKAEAKGDKGNQSGERRK
jgi:hypothetical protein